MSRNSFIANVAYNAATETATLSLAPALVDAIARTDYDQPIARQRPTAPPPEPALPREGGVFRRFLDGFRYR